MTATMMLTAAFIFSFYVAPCADAYSSKVCVDMLSLWIDACLLACYCTSWSSGEDLFVCCSEQRSRKSRCIFAVSWSCGKIFAESWSVVSRRVSLNDGSSSGPRTSNWDFGRASGGWVFGIAEVGPWWTGVTDIIIIFQKCHWRCKITLSGTGLWHFQIDHAL